MTITTWIMAVSAASTTFLAAVTGLYHTRRWLAWPGANWILNMIRGPLPFADLYLDLADRSDMWLELQYRFRGRKVTVTGKMKRPEVGEDNSEPKLYQLNGPKEGSWAKLLVGGIPNVWAYESDVTNIFLCDGEVERSGALDKPVKMTGKIYSIATVSPPNRLPCVQPIDDSDRPFIRLTDVTIEEKKNESGKAR